MKKLTQKVVIRTKLPFKEKHVIGWILLASMIILFELSIVFNFLNK